MDFSALLAAFASGFDQDNRLFQLHFADGGLDGQLLPHTLSGEESLSDGYRLALVCLSPDTAIGLKALLGQPVDIAIRLSEGGERILSGVVTEAQQLGADGGFACYGLTVEPALAALALRRNSRVFQDKTVVDIVGLILDEHIAANPVFAQCFRHREQLTASYPARSYCQQYRESDLAFIQRLLREEGISYTFDFNHGADEVGVHTLVLFDAGTELEPAPHRAIRFHRADATEASDSITDWQASRQIQSAGVLLASFDYKGVYTQQGADSSRIDQGEAGTGLTSSLEDYDPQSLYYGSDNSDVSRYATLRQQAHDLSAKTFSGSGVVRGLGAGQWFALNDHPLHDQDAEADRQFVVTRQRFAARNNLPGDLSGIAASEPLPQSSPTSLLGLTGAGYKNQFSAVRKSIPIVPAYSAALDPQNRFAKPTAPGVQTASVVGPAGEEVFTDELGRIKIQFHWAREQDHAVGQHGAGATRDDFSSCWVRIAYPSAGANWGHQFIPRIGQEVLIEFIEGDIDRPVVVGALYNGQHAPPNFSGKGSLPANKTLSGIKSQEFNGNRYNELLLDDSSGEIRTKLSTEHGSTQLNQGYLIHPRSEGKGEPRGEGFELRTDNAGSVRAAQGLLITTEQQANAGGKQLQRGATQAVLDAAATQADQLGAAAKTHTANQPETGKDNQTVNADSQPGNTKNSGHLHQLKDASANLERKSNTDKDGKSGSGDQPGQQSILLVSGQQGISLSTPQSAVIVTGSNLDQIALGDSHQSTGRRWISNAAESISLFVAGAQNALKESFKLIAAKGNIQLQAQSADIEITADQSLSITSCKDSITVSAKEEILIACGGGYIRLKGSNIEVHCPGTIDLKAADHTMTGPPSLTQTMKSFPTTSPQSFDQAFIATWAGLDIPANNVKYRLRNADGQIIAEGITNDKGETSLLKSQVPDGIFVELLDK